MDVEDPACRNALAVLQDVAQLCKVMRGESESCSFTSVCSDCFTGVAMQHLCAPAPNKSAPSQVLMPVIESLVHSGNNLAAHLNQTGQNGMAAAAVAATEAARLSMALAEERSAGIAELQARLAAKDAESQALTATNAALKRALEEKEKQSPPPKSAGGPQGPGASLVLSGVQMIPSSELDLDLSNKVHLGSGVYSEVYQSNRQIALKVLRGRFNQQRFREFKHEAEMLQLMQGSTGVCRLHGICVDSLPNLYLVTEPVLGGTLEAYLQSVQSKGVPMERAIPLARSIASAMKDMHAKGMVHRDLKPSNCLITKYDKNSIKIIDFGLARLLQGDFIPPEDHDGAGTPMYQAPEVLQNAGVGKGTDVFSFGIMMWEMISGESPYEGLSLNEMKSAVLAGARPSIKAGWSKEWTDIMRSCWAQDPSKRPTFVTLDQMLTQMQPSQRMQFSAPDADAVAHMVQQATRSASKGVESGPLFQHQPAAAHFSQSASSGTSYGGPGMMSHGSMKSQMQGQAMLSPEVAHARQAPPVHMPPHPQHQTPNSPHITQQVGGSRVSPSMKTMASPQYGGVVHDMEEM